MEGDTSYFEEKNDGKFGWWRRKVKVILPSLFLFFTWATSTTLGGGFFWFFLAPLEKEWRIGGFLWKNQKSYFYVCMHGWNIKVLKFWNISRSQGGILWNLWKLYMRRMKQYKFGGTFGDPTILFYFCIILLVSFNVCVFFLFFLF